jgi:Transcriptional regulator, AbiEi antitoxin
MTLPPRLAAIAATQCGLFTTSQALAAGYNADEIARLRREGSWARLRRGVYIEPTLMPADAVGIHLLVLRAALLTLTGPLAASHMTSAALQGIAMLEPDLSLVHITRADAGSPRTVAGIRHHDASLPAGHLTRCDAVLTTGAARTVVDIARQATFEAALVATESALHQGLATLAELREVMAYCADWPGARRAGRVVAFASPYSETPGETMGRIAFDELGVPPPEQQVLIFDDRGLAARADYYWEKYHTVGEFDGKLKYAGDASSDDALFREKQREDRLREAGLEVFRIGWGESRARSTSIRRKAFSAFERAARSTAKRSYRVQRQPPPQ